MNKTRYRRTDTGETIEVLPSFNGAWISCSRRPSGAIRRLKSPRLPARHTWVQAQADLDAYAASRGWPEERTTDN